MTFFSEEKARDLKQKMKIIRQIPFFKKTILVGVFLFSGIGEATKASLFSIDEAKKDASAEVVVFLSLDCPICIDMLDELDSIQKICTVNQITFKALVPASCGTKQEDYEVFINKFNPSFPIAIDSSNQLVRKLKAKITPEIFLIKGRKVLYRGLIDDSFYRVGEKKGGTPTPIFLKSLNQFIKGERIDVSSTTAIGCIIEKK